jgi:hypothetical protein
MIAITGEIIVIIMTYKPYAYGLFQLHFYVSLSFNLSRDSSVGIATGWRMEGRVSIPGTGKDFLFFTTSRPALGTTQPPIQYLIGCCGSFLVGVKWQRREDDHSPLSNAKDKNGGAIPALPHTSS